MALPTRLDIKGGWYHVVNRGIEKRAIFRGVRGMQYPAVTMAIRRFTKRLEGEKTLAKKIKRLDKLLLVLVKT